MLSEPAALPTSPTLKSPVELKLPVPLIVMVEVSPVFCPMLLKLTAVIAAPVSKMITPLFPKIPFRPGPFHALVMVSTPLPDIATLPLFAVLEELENASGALTFQLPVPLKTRFWRMLPPLAMETSLAIVAKFAELLVNVCPTDDPPSVRLKAVPAPL